MKKNPSWERSKNASRSSGVLSWLGSGKAVGIAFPSPEKWGGYLLQGRRPPPLLLDDDPPGHGRPVNRTLVGVGSGIPKRDRVAVAGPAHHHTVPEDLRDRAGRLDAVRARGVPGPGDAVARRDRIHGGVRGSVVGTSQEDVAHQDVADRVAAPAGRGHTAASCEQCSG